MYPLSFTFIFIFQVRYVASPQVSNASGRIRGRCANGLVHPAIKKVQNFEVVVVRAAEFLARAQKSKFYSSSSTTIGFETWHRLIKNEKVGQPMSLLRDQENLQMEILDLRRDQDQTMWEETPQLQRFRKSQRYQKLEMKMLHSLEGAQVF